MTIMAPDPQSSVPVFEGIHNFRDFGGYAVPGGRVRLGKLYRSAHYATATDADLASFADLGMAAIVDLRRPAERARFVTRRSPDCGARMISYGAPSDEVEPPHLGTLGDPGVTEAVITERMIDVYRGLAHEPGHLQVFGDAFKALAEAEGPIVVHCHAGKDRTGLIVAFIQHTLGVSADDILADYLLTNTASRIEERLPEIARTFREVNGHDAPLSLLRHVYRVEEAYLRTAYQAIAAADGSLDAYIETRLGVTPALKARLRERLIEAA